MKKIELSTKDIKTLVELMERGLAYTDAHYRDYKRMDSVFDKVYVQLKNQGATYDYRGIKFR